MIIKIEFNIFSLINRLLRILIKYYNSLYFNKRTHLYNNDIKPQFKEENWEVGRYN